MSYRLLARAQRDLREYVYHIAAHDWRDAMREGARIAAELARFSALDFDTTQVRIAGRAEPVSRHYVHPFYVYYVRRPPGIVVLRLWHHARRPIER